MLRQRHTGSTSLTQLLSPSKSEKESSSRSPANANSTKYLKWLKRATLLTVLVYAFIPIWIHFCPWIRRHVILLSSCNVDFLWDLSNPAEFGLPCAKHSYLTGEGGVRLGVWHIPPKYNVRGDVIEEPICFRNGSDWNSQDEFDSERPVILYFHGTGFTRGTYFRREFYKIVTDGPLNAHVITFDYRGFGDSSPVKAEMGGILKDAEAVYMHYRARVSPRSRLILWGHSLGSAMATQLAYKFAGTGNEPYAVILESTFTNMYDAIYSFPFSALHNFWPGFDRFVARVAAFHPDTCVANDDKMHLAIASPLLILHAEDDQFLTVNQARKLFRLAKTAYDRNDVVADNKTLIKLFEPTYVEFEAKLGYGHKYLTTDQRLPDIILQFLANIESKFS